jgi:hypothetical protein
VRQLGSAGLAAVIGTLAAACGRIGFDPRIDAALDPSLVAWYSCDAVLGDGVVTDLTGHGHDASCTVGVTCPTIVPGVHGNACSFDGISQFLRVTNDAAFNTGVFTVAVFGYRPMDNPRALMTKPAGTGNGNSWNLETIGCTATEMAFYGGNTYSCFNVQDLPFDGWSHFALGYDGARKSAYVNGEQRLDVADTSITLDNNDIFLGSDSNNNIQVSFYAGPLDDIRIYDRLLSPSEIAALAN